MKTPFAIIFLCLALLASLHARAAETLTNGLQFYFKLDTLAGVDSVAGNNVTDETPGTLALVFENNDPNANPYGPRVGRCWDGGNNSSGFKPSHAHNEALSLGTNDFTVSCWVHANGASWPASFPAFIDKSDIFDGGNTGYLLYYATGFGLRFLVGNGTSLGAVVSSVGTAPSTTTWQLVVGRYSSSAQKVYISVNGSNTTDSASWTGGRATNSAKFCITAPSNASGLRWPRLIDDVAGWNRCLTDAEVQRIYDYGNQKGQGYPWGTQTNYVVMFQGDARFLYPNAFPEPLASFSRLSWVSNHTASCVSTCAMYICARGDASFPPLVDRLANVTNLVGAGTNLTWVTEITVNDIILINQAYTNWANVPANTTNSIGNAVTQLTNAMTVLYNAGVRIIPISIYDVVEWAQSSPAEEAMLSYANNILTNYALKSAWVDGYRLIGTNYQNAEGSELTDLGESIIASNLNLAFIAADAGDTTAPTLTSSTIDSAGLTIALLFSEPVTRNSGTPTLSLSGGACTPTYSSGSGGASHVYTLSRIVYFGETGTLSATLGTDVWEDPSGNDVATISNATVTNGSTVAPNSSRLTRSRGLFLK